MKTRPINLTTDEVRAVIDGRMTQLRRPVGGCRVRPTPGAVLALAGPDTAVVAFDAASSEWYADGGHWHKRSPFGAAGDRLVVREAWRLSGHGRGPEVLFAANVSDAHRKDKGPWRSSATMPRSLSRVTLDVIAVRVERVQSITEADARATGAVDDTTMLGALSHVRGAAAVAAVPSRLLSARDNFATAWDARFGKTAPWAANPWCWRVDVKRVEGERC